MARWSPAGAGIEPRMTSELPTGQAGPACSLERWDITRSQPNRIGPDGPLNWQDLELGVPLGLSVVAQSWRGDTHHGI